MSEQNLVCISEPSFPEYFLTLGFEVKSETHLSELLSLEWSQRAGTDAISERNALKDKVSGLEISMVSLISTSLRNLRNAAQLTPPIALSQALVGIDTGLWEQNNTIDQAAKALVEQWHLICGMKSMVQQLLNMAKEVGLDGPLVDEIEAVAVESRQVPT